MYLFDVIIIGSGISGMVAAHTILEKEPSLDLIILEATERIGGRTLSTTVQVNNSETQNFDISAHFVSSSQKHLINLINELNLTLIQQEHNGLSICEETKNVITNFIDHPCSRSCISNYELRWFFAELEEKSTHFRFDTVHKKFAVELNDCLSMEFYIRNKLWTKSARTIAKNIVKTTTGLDASQISLMYYLLLCNSTFGFTNHYLTHDGGGREYWIYEGATSICSELQKRIGPKRIIKNDPVIRIDKSDPNKLIEISTSNRIKYVCYHCIIAIPPKEICKINFNPPLDKNARIVLENFKNGHTLQFVITYPTAFWKHKGYSGEIFCCIPGSINLCYDATKDNNPALFGYINNPILSENGDTSHKEYVINQLVRYFGNEAGNPIDYVEKFWLNEPFIGGCPMSCTEINTFKWFHSLKDYSTRIHWAGTEMATEWTGYMNGAIQSGQREAINVLYYIRPQSLTYMDIHSINSNNPHRIRFQKPKFFNGYTVTAIVIFGVYILYKYLKF